MYLYLYLYQYQYLSIYPSIHLSIIYMYQICCIIDTRRNCESHLMFVNIIIFPHDPKCIVYPRSMIPGFCWRRIRFTGLGSR